MAAARGYGLDEDKQKTIGELPLHQRASVRSSKKRMALMLDMTTGSRAGKDHFARSFVVPLALSSMLNPTNSTMISTARTPIAEDFEANVTQPRCHPRLLPDQSSRQVPDPFAALLRSRTPLAQGLAPFVGFTND